MVITGRNEVLAKVIFSQASVILFMGGGSGPGGYLQIFGGGSSKIWGWGCLQFFGRGGPPIFLGGVPPNFRGGGGLHRNTVNVRPVRILLECILVCLSVAQFTCHHANVKSRNAHFYNIILFVCSPWG